jgi:hypothetical protein
MRFLLAELGFESQEQDFVRMHEEFNKLLLQEARAGKRFIIVVDEAQNLDPSVLETVRLLSDFETPRAKLLQIILAGQPELADKLSSPKLSQLRQRISVLNGLPALSAEETSKYIQHRLRTAGHSGAPLFSPTAIHAIAEFTEGVPRSVNNFCFSALSLGCALHQRVIGPSVVDEVISDLDMTKHVTEVHPASPLDPAFLRAATIRNSAVPVATSYAAVEQPAADTLTPAEAQVYMRKLAGQLKDWKRNLD